MMQFSDQLPGAETKPKSYLLGRSQSQLHIKTIGRMNNQRRTKKKKRKVKQRRKKRLQSLT